VHSFTTSDGVRLNYYMDVTPIVDQAADIAAAASAMGTAKRCYAMVNEIRPPVPDGAPRFAQSWQFADSG
jgi:hypothetical protein